MREWVEATVARVLAYRPQRVLEIGCGLGLLLFRIAPHCRAYCATDFARPALDYIERHLREAPLPKVRLFARPAHAVGDLAGAPFDAGGLLHASARPGLDQIA